MDIIENKCNIFEYTPKGGCILQTSPLGFENNNMSHNKCNKCLILKIFGFKKCIIGLLKKICTHML
jgi:hypothetical protein